MMWYQPGHINAVLRLTVEYSLIFTIMHMDKLMVAFNATSAQ